VNVLESRIRIERLRSIGWSHWDPIGLADEDSRPPDGAADEYDSYLLCVAGMLSRGATESESIDYLIGIVSTHMSLGVADGDAAKQTVQAIRDYLTELGFDGGVETTRPV
jgi:hypothetical protein